MYKQQIVGDLLYRDSHQLAVRIEMITNISDEQHLKYLHDGRDVFMRHPHGHHGVEHGFLFY